MDTVTNTTLLIGLKESGNDRAWSEFAARYRPLVTAFARKLGLSEHDAQDAAQEAMLAFASAYRDGRYDRDKGRLRQWLLGIAVNKIRDLRRSKKAGVLAQQSQDATDWMQDLPDDHSLSEVWEAEWRRELIRQCVDRARKHLEPATIAAFERFVLDDQPAEKVAAELGITANAVFKAKRRVLSHIREMYEHLTEIW